MLRSEFADELRKFVDNCSDPYGFDDLVSTPFEDPMLESFRLEIVDLPNVYPPTALDSYTSVEGLYRLRKIIDEIEAELR